MIWLLALALPTLAAVALLGALVLVAQTICDGRDHFLRDHPASGWQRCAGR